MMAEEDHLSRNPRKTCSRDNLDLGLVDAYATEPECSVFAGWFSSLSFILFQKKVVSARSFTKGENMFFTLCRFYVLGLLPAHGGFPRRLRVGLGYYDCRDKIAAWHRAELERLDFNYRLQQASLRLIVAREKAQAEGIGPLDSRYPILNDFLSDPPVSRRAQLATIEN